MTATLRTTTRRTTRLALAFLAVLPFVTTVSGRTRHRTGHRTRGDDGYTVETVIVVGLLAAAAVTILAIVTAAVVAKANSLSF